MSCAVAVAGSPVFSPSRVSLLCKSASSPETLALSGSPSTSPSAMGSSLSSSLSSPSSSFRLRCLQKQASNLRSCKIDARLVDSDPSSSAAAAAAAASTVLKRKRPAKIDIPTSSLSFATPMKAPEGPTEVEIETGRFSVFCKKGRREAMEDRHSAVLDLQGDPKQAFFGVFDGHGGSRAAEFASENLEKNIIDQVMKRGDGGIEAAVKSGYLTTDAKFLKEDVRGGTCCVTALIRNGDLVVSNAGDCRAVMSKGGVAEALTTDHRPSRADEKSRIECLGGYVDSCNGVWRIQGSLAVSRGIGDAHLKKWVIAEPETKVIRLKSEYEFLILASDGLWDKVSNQEAVDMVRTMCINSDSHPSLLAACKKLAGLSIMRGSSDDISVMIIQLGHFI